MKYLPLVFLLITLPPPTCFGDGGTLSIQTLDPEDESTEWAFCPLLFDARKNPFPIKIDDKPSLPGFELHTQFSFIQQRLTASDPPLYCHDINGDGRFGKFPPQEVTAGETLSLDRTDRQNSYIFRNAPFPMTYPLIPDPVFVDIFSWEERVRGRIQRVVQFARCKTIYEGTMTVQDQSYAARLIFRSLDIGPFKPNLCIILDTNQDGIFHPFEDLWFSGDWYACIENQWWTVKTTLNRHTAEVVLEPYVGATGTLQLQGEAIARVCLGKLYGKPTPTSPKVFPPRSNTPIPEYELVLPFRSDSTYTLPVGEYTFTNIVLQSKQSEGLYYQWPVSLQADIHYSPFQIVANQTHSAWVGGPLHDRIKVKSVNLYDRAQVRYEGSFNEQYDPFIEVKYEYLYRNDAIPLASWILQDSQGQEIQTGSFFQKQAQVAMPFMRYGTYQIQRKGSDNELITRAIVPFEYRSKLPFVWGIPLIIVLGFTAFLLRIDRTYSLAKLWVLVPGIVGILILFIPSDDFSHESIVFFKFFGTGPFMVTCMLIACRAFLPHRIATVFFTTLITGIASLSATSLLFASELFLAFYIVAGVYAIQFSVFYQIVQKNPSPKRLWMGYGIGCLLPSLLFLFPILLTRQISELLIFGMALLFFSGIMMPLSLLTAWNPWVRNLFAQRLVDPNPPPIYEPDKTDWAA